MSEERAAAIAAWRKELELTLVLARNATNGWACYAKRQIEHDEIARLHNAISEVERRLSALPATEGAGDQPTTEKGSMPISELECPCCGDVAARADMEGFFHDGDRLVCGCYGWVTADGETLHISGVGDEPCPTCESAALPPVRAEEPTARIDELAMWVLDGKKLPDSTVVSVGYWTADPSAMLGERFDAVVRTTLGDLRKQFAAALPPVQEPRGGQSNE